MKQKLIIVIAVVVLGMFGLSHFMDRQTKSSHAIFFEGRHIDLVYEDLTITRLEVETIEGAGVVFDEVDRGAGNYFNLLLVNKLDELTSIEISAYNENDELVEKFSIDNILLSFDSKSSLIEKADYLHMANWDNFEDYSERISKDIKGLSLDLRDDILTVDMLKNYKKLESLKVNYIEAEGSFDDLKHLSNLRSLRLIGGKIENASFLNSNWKHLLHFGGSFKELDFKYINCLDALVRLGVRSDNYIGSLDNTSIEILFLEANTTTSINIINNDVGLNLEGLYLYGDFTGNINVLVDAPNLLRLRIHSSTFDIDEGLIDDKYPNLLVKDIKVIER